MELEKVSMVYGKSTPPRELLSCPFCGGEPYLYTTYNDHLDKTTVRVKCLSCGARGPKAHTAGYHRSCDQQIEEMDIHAMKLWEQRVGKDIKDDA